MNNSRHIVSTSPGRALAEIGETPLAPVDRIDLSGSVSFFRRRLWLIVSIIALALVAGAAISAMQTRTYTATAVVSLRPPPEAQAGASGVVATAPPANNAYVDTQVEIIRSREMAEQVASGLALLTGRTPREQRGIVDELQGNVSAERSGESYALTIRYNGGSGTEAAERANEYARQFAGWELRLIRQQNQQSSEAIQQRLNELREQAQQDTAALQHYRIANNLLSTSGSSLTEQEISSYNQEVTRARAEAAEDQARLNTALNQLRSGSSGDDVGEALGSSVIASLRAQEAEVGAEVASLSSRYGDNHPALIRARSELQEIHGQINAEIGRVVSNLRARQAVSQQRLASLTGSLSQAQATLSQNNAAMIGLDELERKAQVSQGLYESYLNTYQQLVASEGTEQSNARILSLAQAPLLPSSPNIPMNMLLALCIGLGAGLVTAFLAETFFKGITGAEEVESKLRERYLGSIPLLASVSQTQRREVTAIGKEPRSAFAEAFRALRTSVEQSTHGPAQVLAITSALPKEGKTVTAVCLAQTYAMSGARTVLVDCDEARHGVSRMLQVQKGHPGLLEVMKDESTLDDALVNSEAGLSVLPINKAQDPSEALVSGDELDGVIAELRQRFDRIILDLPPILPVAAARNVAAKADVTVVLVRWRQTAAAAATSALHQMPADRINIAGVVLTQVDMRRRSLFGRQDPSFYYREYREYYA